MDWYKEKLDYKSPLVVSFAGGSKGFDFERTLEIENSHLKFQKIYIFDPRLGYWQLPFPDLPEKYKEPRGIGLAKFLSDKIKESKAPRVCFTGISKGAYAAILFGVKLNIQLVIAFAPQTHLDLLHQSYRLKEKFEPYGIELKNGDLRTTLEGSGGYNTIIHVFYGKAYSVDTNYFNHIKDCRNVIDRGREGHNLHNIAKFVIRDGTMTKMLSDFVYGK